MGSVNQVKKLMTKEEFLNSGYFDGCNIVTDDILHEHYNNYLLTFYNYNY